jgi:hypothetical protein
LEEVQGRIPFLHAYSFLAKLLRCRTRTHIVQCNPFIVVTSRSSL